LVLTGIHLGGYGQDLRPKIDLTSLVEKIVESCLIHRLRLSSLDPCEVPDRLLDLMAKSDVLCPHLHVCLQAGEDGILKRMRRNYDTAYYRELMIRAREILPDAALGTDLIVGFPGETDTNFERSIEFIDSLPLTYFHVFPYSTRTGTVAATLPDPVPLQLRRERARRIREIGARKKRGFYRQFIGSRVSVLVEERMGGVSGFYKGYSRNYLPILFCADKQQVNREVNVSLKGLEGGRLRGRIVEGH
jgi:threonylcarbamoyladenosine tRNA methylthiotransferase MtaB